MLPVYRLRRLLAVVAVLLTMVVAGMYLYARFRTRNVRNRVPNKIGYDIKQTANGFQFSKSDGKRTLFSVQASDVKEFKLNGRAELHNVNIVLYGRDSSRYDQISGDEFAYDPKTGKVTAQGEVRIDLVANPGGIASPDQSAPKEIKNAVHLMTRGLVFDRETGDAFTDAPVEFSTPQASGSALGVKYAGKSNFLSLRSHIHLVLTGPNSAVIDADSGIITNEPRQIVLEHPQLEHEGETLRADRAKFHLGFDNNLERVEASGNVVAQTRAAGRQGPQASQVSDICTRSDSAEILLSPGNLLRIATMAGNVHVEQSGNQPIQADAGRLIFEFAGQNQLQSVRATDGAVLSQTTATGEKSGTQNYQLTAPTVTFAMGRGRFLERAETGGAARITISSTQANVASVQPSPGPQKTVVTAGTFEARFANEHDKAELTSIHGAPDARLVNSAPGQPDRVSTSASVDAIFYPHGGIQSITQKGNVAYTDNQPPDKRIDAWASAAQYTPEDQTVVLTGNPRVASAAMATTAKTIRINRATGEAVADTDVKSTYSQLKEQPNGALLASSSPIHITAASMTVQNDPGIALYTGSVRLWQDANVIEAPGLQFDRERRFVTARGTPTRPVQTILVQPRGNVAASTREKRQSPASPGASSPITITSRELTYSDSERKIHYEGEVLAKGGDFSASCKTLDAYLLPRGGVANAQPLSGPGQLERMVAQGNVLVQQPNRRAEGQTLVYTTAEEKFVLTGGPPSIFDAEHGKITGVSLTFFRRDDRVLVEGEPRNPVVTTTRVAP